MNVIACICVIVNRLHNKLNVINYHYNYFSEKKSQLQLNYNYLEKCN